MKLQTAHRHTLSGPLWRLLPDAEGMWLAAEVRSTQHIHIEAIQLATGRCHKLCYLPPNASVLQIVGNMVLLGNYAAANIPAMAKAQLWNVLTGQCLWQHDEAVPLILTQRALYVELHGEKVCIDLADFKQSPTDHIPRWHTSAWQYPNTYDEKSIYYPQIATFIQKKIGHTPVWACDYLEHEQGIVLMYYICAGKNFEQHLAIIDNTGKVVQETVTAENLHARIMQTFLLSHGRLIFVNNNDTINICYIL